MRSYRDDVRMAKALADKNRLQILKSLQESGKCGCDLLDELNITQPTLSHHMKILCDAGIVEAVKDGKWVNYSLSAEGSNQLNEMVQYYTLVK